MTKFNSKIGLLSFFIGSMLWGAYFFFDAHPSLFIGDYPNLRSFIFVRNVLWGTGFLSLVSMVLGLLVLRQKKRDKTLSSLIYFGLTFTGCFLSGSFSLLIFVVPLLLGF